MFVGTPWTKPDKAQVVAIAQPAALGDVIITLPMAWAIKRHDPTARVLMIGRQYSRPLIEAARWLDGYLDVEEVIERPTILREHGVSGFINPKQSMELGHAARMAGVAQRIGKLNPRSLLWANRFVYFNAGGQTGRHRAVLHLRYLEPLGIRIEPTLEELGSMVELNRVAPLPLDIQRRLDPKRFKLILHPKSGGSGREWPAAHYDRLADLLSSTRIQIIVTGRPAERDALLKERALLNRDGIVDLTGQLDLPAMIALLQSADGLIASSTGPLHIAAAVGVHALGLFPGRALISATRWHPLGIGGEALSAPGECRPARDHCAADADGGPCACMLKITPEQVAARVRNWMKESEAACR